MLDMLIKDIKSLDCTKHTVETCFMSLLNSVSNVPINAETFDTKSTIEDVGLSSKEFLYILEKMNEIYDSSIDLTCISYNNCKLRIIDIIIEIDRIL